MLVAQREWVLGGALSMDWPAGRVPDPARKQALARSFSELEWVWPLEKCAGSTPVASNTSDVAVSLCMAPITAILSDAGISMLYTCSMAAHF